MGICPEKNDAQDTKEGLQTFEANKQVIGIGRNQEASYRIGRHSFPKPHGKKPVIDDIIAFVLIDELTV